MIRIFKKMNAIGEIKQKLDIVEVVSEYVSLQKAGRSFKALCPFHSERTPSFFVFPEQQSWRCFGACSTGGDIYSFIMKKEGLDFGQALRFLADKAGITIADTSVHDKELDNRRDRLLRINEAAAAYYHHLLTKTASSEKARNYLEQRGLSPQIIDAFQLGVSRDSFEDILHHLSAEGFKESEIVAAGLALERDSGGSYDRFRNRLMFPIRDIQGHVTGFGARALDDSLPKYLNSPQTLVFDKSSSLYGIDRAKTAIRQKNVAIITEGYMDVLTAHQHGWENTVASMGTALTEKQLSVLKKLTKNLILALDADSAGEEATGRIAETVDIENYLKAEVKVAVPVQGKDPDEEIREDPALWSESLMNAKSIGDFMIDSVTSRVDLGSAMGKNQAVENLLPLLSKINDPTRRGHYTYKLAQILKIKDQNLHDQLNKFIKDHKKIKKNIGTESITPGKKLFSSSNPIEEYCLGLLLQFSELRPEGMKIPQDYFEYNENREIFLKWQKNSDIESLRKNIDVALYPHLDSLLTKVYPPSLKDNDEKQLQVFSDSIIRLREKQIRNLEAKKAELLAIESEIGGHAAAQEKQKEQGIEESQQLKQVFNQQHHQRQQMVMKE